MSFLTTIEKDTLREQIKIAERSTTGEIVTVIANQSDGYRFIPLLMAALISLSIPGLFLAYQSLTSTSWGYPNEAAIGFVEIYQLQVLIFLGLASLFQWTPIRFWLVPKTIKQQRAKRHANEQFYVQRLHLTEGRTGVLVFVSVAEHYVEIIVDQGVSDVVDNTVWEQSIDGFIQHVSDGNIATGFRETVALCQEILSQHFPASADQIDELPNHLIEINN